MSTIETILSRAMNESEFAEQLFTDPEMALADYELTVDEMTLLIKMSHTQFDALSPEERKSFVVVRQKELLTLTF